MAILELAILEQRAQILGGIAMFDLGNLSMQQAWYITPSMASKIVQIMVVSRTFLFLYPKKKKI